MAIMSMPHCISSVFSNGEPTCRIPLPAGDRKKLFSDAEAAENLAEDLLRVGGSDDLTDVFEGCTKFEIRIGKGRATIPDSAISGMTSTIQ